MDLMKSQHASHVSKVLNSALHHSLNVPQKKLNLSILHVIEISHYKKTTTNESKARNREGNSEK